VFFVILAFTVQEVWAVRENKRKPRVWKTSKCRSCKTDERK